MISKTPRNPITIAPIRRHPIGSERNSALASVTESGKACKIALTLANGILKSAVRKNHVAPTSINVRRIKRRRSVGDKLVGKGLMNRISTISSSVVVHPRRKSVWKSGRSIDNVFMKVSLTVNAVIDPIMSSAPRILSETFAMMLDSRRQGFPLQN